ncbi:sodium/potassium/calcium exchanger 2-like isoform X1 [Limulus polyphemus]|uniref:Sodium/potassium/calcium exchanger 2-like isoform X1 n=1 Tax=Limulus polyphemus TaxID=6850 RepID=A0ABM1C5D3_LIMPO|nr:sodium/potassium/calcium exchanger 2-like isoform X1 [Limulus polyphemus]XP_022237792.1 sodium/potassium/calcium exchanger 2-like isoform X1 [Limulus polyphemus]
MEQVSSKQFLKKRWRPPLQVFGVGLSLVFFLSYFYSTSIIIEQTSPSGEWKRFWDLEETELEYNLVLSRHLLQSASQNASEPTKKPPQFPEDLFSEQQRKNGAVVFHVFGLVYMFAGLAIVCDEFFRPSLDVITEKLQISEDVAGATFMAAGGSAPELFTSIIGVFISFDDVGIGTIVGSAVFNILFVISMCAIFSKDVLQLTWWPLFRDVTFYSIILIILMVFFNDNVIFWHEALILFLCYLAYVSFMKFNSQIEQFVKRILNRNKVKKVGSTDHLMPGLGRRRVSRPILHAGSKFRQGLLQLMIHSIDPLHDGKLDEKASQLHAIASLRVLLEATKPRCTGKSNGSIVTHGAPSGGNLCSACATCPTCVAYTNCSSTKVHPVTITVSSTDVHNYVTTVDTGTSSVDEIDLGEQSKESQSNRQLEHMVSLTSLSGSDYNEITQDLGQMSREATDIRSVGKTEYNTGGSSPSNLCTITTDSGPSAVLELCPETQQSEEILEQEKPLDISWPTTWRKRLNYILMAPIIFPLWLTLPDVRRKEKRKWFPITFIGSIIWIAFFSYLMVWWASLTGEAAGIPNEVMGLTFLAAGTSIPDLITSVLVARKGLGDMAVSSSIGSNIFDVAVGLPVPWLLACFIFGPVTVSSTGMTCYVLLLFLMVLFVIISIAGFKWRMNIGLACVMFFLYFVFIALSLLLEYGIISCAAIMGPFGGG